MSKIITALKLMKNNPEDLGRALDSNFAKMRITHFIPDTLYLKVRYRLCIHNKLNFRNPLSFNEKLQWLKVYYHNPLYEKLVDKYEVKFYVKNNFPDLKIIPTLGVWDTPEEIEYDKLPNQFVIKCTHDSGSIIICNDKKKLDVISTNRKLKAALNKNMYYSGREWVYKNLKPRIIAEELISDGSDELKDYKLMCFNGTFKCCFVCSERFSGQGLHVTFFDENWNILPFSRHYPRKNDGIPKPKCYDRMIILAEKMSQGMPFVRIDFYEVRDEIYFGEYTFFPGSGFEEFEPEKWDYIIGEWLHLPTKEKIK